MISEAGLRDDPTPWVYAILARADQRLTNPPILYYDALLRMYREQERAETGKLIRIGLQGVLDQAQDGGDGEVLKSALDLIADARIGELAPALARMVEHRALDATIGARTDLHGRALTALYANNALDLAHTWEVEKEHGRFAPLVFSFIRDRHPERLPELFVHTARLGFLQEAVETTAIELRAQDETDRGFRLLHAGAKRVRESGDRIVQQEFWDCILVLDLPPVLQHRLLREVEPLYRSAVVLNRLPEPLRSAVDEGLEMEKVATEGDFDAAGTLLLVRDTEVRKEGEDGCAPLTLVLSVPGERAYQDERGLAFRSIPDESPQSAEHVVEQVLRLLWRALPANADPKPSVRLEVTGRSPALRTEAVGDLASVFG